MVRRASVRSSRLTDEGRRSVLVIDILGLSLLFVLSAFYFIFGVSFAETNVLIFNGMVPVFVGELVLTACLILFFIRWSLTGWALNKVALFIVVMYGLWILVKALLGFSEAGGYALRNAALYYYPFTALFAYVFIRDRPIRLAGIIKKTGFHLTNSVLFTLVLALALAQVVFSFSPFVGYLACMCALLFWAYLKTAWRRSLGGTVLAAALLVGGLLSCSGRTHLVALLLAVFFLVIYVIILKFRSQIVPALLFAFVLVAGFFLLVIVMSDSNTVKSLATPGRWVELFRDYEVQIREKGLFLRPPQGAMRIYNANRPGRPEPVLKSVALDLREGAAKKDVSGQIKSDSASEQAGVGPREKGVSQVTDSSVQGSPAGIGNFQPATRLEGEHFDSVKPGCPMRSLGTAYNNILFRYFIWRDMADEFLMEKPLLSGFSFGHSQRSSSIETLGWAQGEWERDGWIAPHNSFLHFIYRGGLVGLGVIILILGYAFWTMRVLFRSGSLAGGIFLSVIVFGLVTAFFNLFLELPYTAIPFWTLFGLLAGYARQQKLYLTRKARRSVRNDCEPNPP